MSEMTEQLKEKQAEIMVNMIIRMTKEGKSDAEIVENFNFNLRVILQQEKIDGQMDFLRDFVSFAEKDERAYRPKGWVEFLNEQQMKLAEKMKNLGAKEVKNNPF